MVSSRLVRPETSENNPGTTVKGVTTEQEFFLTEPVKRKKERQWLIRKAIITKYRWGVGTFNELPLFKQLLPLMIAIKDNYDFLTDAEIISLLRKGNGINQDPPTKGELQRLKQLMGYFRYWLGKGSLVIYSKREKRDEYKKYGIQKIYEPIHDRREYLKWAGKVLIATGNGIATRHENNLETLNLPWREREKNIERKMLELDQTGMLIAKVKKRKRRQ